MFKANSICNQLSHRRNRRRTVQTYLNPFNLACGVQLNPYPVKPYVASFGIVRCKPHTLKIASRYKKDASFTPF